MKGRGKANETEARKKKEIKMGRRNGNKFEKKR